MVKHWLTIDCKIIASHFIKINCMLVGLDCIDYVPYFENNYLAVAASLNGGNVLDYFVRSVLCWISALGLTITEGKSY